jgi:hypothetical protein
MEKEKGLGVSSRPFKFPTAVLCHARDRVKQPSLQCAQRGTMYLFNVTPPSMNRVGLFFHLKYILSLHNVNLHDRLSTSARLILRSGDRPVGNLALQEVGGGPRDLRVEHEPPVQHGPDELEVVAAAQARTPGRENGPVPREEYRQAPTLVASAGVRPGSSYA